MQPVTSRSCLRRTGAHVRGAVTASLLLSAPVYAATLEPGDFVTVTWHGGNAHPCCQVLGLDALSATTSFITSDGYIADPTDISVAADGHILVVVPTVGVVQVDPETGGQTILTSAESLGGAPQGILAGLDGLFVTVQGGGPSRIQRLNSDGSVAGVVSSGGMLQYPAGLALGADGGLYVCETLPVGWMDGGSIVRIDPTSGSQTLIASGAPVHGPFHAAFAPDGSLWSVQRGGLLHETGGYLVRTRVSDGFSERIDFGFNFNYVSGLAIRQDGLTLVADCIPVHSDCEYPFTRVYPDGPTISTSRGPLGVVPDAATHSLRTTWGRIKTMYR